MLISRDRVLDFDWSRMEVSEVRVRKLIWFLDEISCGTFNCGSVQLLQIFCKLLHAASVFCIRRLGISVLQLTVAKQAFMNVEVVTTQRRLLMVTTYIHAVPTSKRCVVFFLIKPVMTFNECSAFRFVAYNREQPTGFRLYGDTNRSFDI